MEVSGTDSFVLCVNQKLIQVL